MLIISPNICAACLGFEVERYTIFGGSVKANWKTEKGKSVGLILKVNKNGEVVVNNEVVTVMDLDTSSNYFKQFFEEGKILYPKNKSIDQLLTGRRQLPTAVADDPFAKNIIHQDSDKVNTTNNTLKNENQNPNQHSFRDVAPKTDSQGRKLSSGQSEYFKNSAVRDGKGNLMVMYHGTPYGGFTQFKNGLTYVERYTIFGGSVKCVWVYPVNFFNRVWYTHYVYDHSFLH